MRIVRKLQELEEDDLLLAAQHVNSEDLVIISIKICGAYIFFLNSLQNNHIQYDLTEFAEAHFNIHEHVIENPPVSTLSRKLVFF